MPVAAPPPPFRRTASPPLSFDALCERFWAPMWLLFLTALVFVYLGWMKRIFWYDELFTLYLSQMSPARLWQALLSGVDQNSPVFYLVSGFTLRWMPSAEQGLRLPALAGGILALTCVFLYIKVRCSALWAWAAIWLLLSTRAAYYMGEARPYGLVLGCTALAFLAWQRRLFWLLTVALGVAGLSHAYSLLLFLPLAAGEIARRQFDFRVWLSFAAGLATFAVYVPIRNGIHLSLRYTWAKPELTRIPEAYLYYLGSMLPLLVAILLLTAGWCLLRPSGDSEPGRIPRHEAVALVVLMLIPFAGLALGKVTGIYTPRYSIECTIGLALAGTFLLYRAARGHAAFALLVCLTAITWHVWGFFSSALRPDTRKLPAPVHETAQLSAAYDLLPYVERSNLPLVASSGLMFFELGHYGSPGLTSRLHMLLDEPTAIEHTQVNITEAGFPLMKQWFPLRGAVEAYTAFARSHPRFLVYGYWDSRTANDWLVYRLLKDGAQVRVVARSDRAWGQPEWATGMNDARYLYLFDVTYLPSTENASSTLPGAPPKLP